MVEQEQEQRAEDPIAMSQRLGIDSHLVDAAVGGCDSDCCNGKADTDADADAEADNYSNCCWIVPTLPVEAA